PPRYTDSVWPPCDLRFLFNAPSTTEIYTLSLHDALPIYNVLPQLDINNTIDHRPEGDEKCFLENEKTVTQFCRKLAAERPLKDIRDEYNYPKKKGKRMSVQEIGRAVQQECRDRSRMPSSA